MGHPIAIGVNPATNKIYAPSVDVANSDFILAYDGNGPGTFFPITEGDTPTAIAVNPVTNKVYVTNEGNNTVMVITPVATQPHPLSTSITPLAGHITSQSQPTFTFSASSSYSPITPPVQQIYYQVDTVTGEWLAASPAGAIASGQTPELQPGLHVLYAYAVDGQAATSINTGRGSSPNPGQIAAYPFLFIPDGGGHSIYLPIVIR